MLSTVSDKWLMSLKKADENKNGIFRAPHVTNSHTPQKKKIWCSQKDNQYMVSDTVHIKMKNARGTQKFSIIFI